MKEIIFFVSFCLMNMLTYAQITNLKDIPEPPSHLVKEFTKKVKAFVPTLTARCFGTVNADGSVKNGSENFGSFLFSGYYHIYIDSNLLKNSTIIMSANRADYRCSYWISQYNSSVYVALYDISKSFVTPVQGEFNFAVFKR